MSIDRVIVNFDIVSGVMSPPVMYTNLKIEIVTRRCLVCARAIVMRIITIRKCWNNGHFVDLHDRILSASARTNLSSSLFNLAA